MSIELRNPLLSPAEKIDVPRSPLFIFVGTNTNDPKLQDSLSCLIPVPEATERIYRILRTSRQGLDSTYETTKQLLTVARKRMSLLSKNEAESVSEKLFLDEAIDLVLWTCKHLCKFEVEMFLSRDRDEIFYNVYCSDEILLHEAIRIGHKLQMRKLSPGERKEHSFKKVAPYITVDASTDTARLACYNADGEIVDSGAIFSPIDRSRLVKSLLSRFVSIPDLEEQKVFIQDYCAHDEKIRSGLSQDWGSITKICSKQPIARVRRYFGEEIALYFSWIGYYKSSMRIPATVGLIVSAIWFWSPSDAAFGQYSLFEWAQIMFCVVLVLWASFFDQFWVRKEKRLAWKWGVTDFEEEEQQRTAYKAPVILDPITNQWKKRPPGKDQFLRRMLSFGVVFLFVAVVIIAVTGIFVYRYILRKTYGGTAGVIAGAVNAVQIKVMNVLYTRVAIRLNEWENHETESQYNDSYAVKLFLFRFINSYVSLFYIAFLKEYVEGECKENNCMKELAVQLGMIFLINFAMNIVELGSPYIKWKLRLWQELRKVKALNSEGAGLHEEMSPIEAQAKLEPYENPLEDYMEMVVQYGYVLLFSAALPIIPLFALLEIMLEIRVDAWKLCKLTRRPFPDMAEDIGVWFYIIQAISYVGAVTNTGIIVFTSTGEDSAKGNWLVFIGIEHALFLLKFLVSVAIPDEPQEVTRGLAWSKIKEEETKGKDVGVAGDFLTFSQEDTTLALDIPTDTTSYRHSKG